eukprot:TRINITY_DN15028_c0_g1_i1.p1 TRINITY_DN15028_c0_g1~~TRINITY_DN15028_c0_g1_i1.p1  ORF type:complete len:341 (-),score=22.84 TRINITY_DN15028_c0_g1_i1:345-1367(-)
MEEVAHSLLKQFVSELPFTARIFSCGYFSQRRPGIWGDALPHDYLVFELVPGINRSSAGGVEEWSFLRVDRMIGGEKYHLAEGLDQIVRNLCGLNGEEAPVLRLTVLLESETKFSTWAPTLSRPVVMKSGVSSTMFLDDVLQLEEFAEKYSVARYNCWYFAAAVLHSIVENQHWEYIQPPIRAVVPSGLVRGGDTKFQAYTRDEGAEYIRLFVLRAILRGSAIRVGVPFWLFPRQRVSFLPPLWFFPFQKLHFRQSVTDVFVALKLMRLMHFDWRCKKGRPFTFPVIKPVELSIAKKLAFRESLLLWCGFILLNDESSLANLSTRKLAKLYGTHALDPIM